MMEQSTHEGSAWTTFVVLLVCAGLFTLTSARYLPPIVASHFGASGQADGFMPRGAYVGVMLVVGVLAPLFTAVVPRRALRRPDARIHLPDPQYWLSAQRRETTLVYLSRQMVHFASMMAVFLAYVQALVVVANRASPPALPMHGLTAGLLLYLASTLLWLVALARHFRRR